MRSVSHFSFLWIPDVAVFHTNAGAVRLLQQLDDLAQLRWAHPHLIPRTEHRVQVALIQSEIFQGQGGLILAPIADGVGIGEEVPSVPVATDQAQHLELLLEALIALTGLRSIGTCEGAVVPL